MFSIYKMLQFFKKPVSVDYITAKDGTIIFDEDVELLKYIRENISKNRPVVIKPPAMAAMIQYLSYKNAKEMLKSGWTQQEILEKTGYWIE